MATLSGRPESKRILSHISGPVFAGASTSTTLRYSESRLIASRDSQRRFHTEHPGRRRLLSDKRIARVVLHSSAADLVTVMDQTLSELAG